MECTVCADIITNPICPECLTFRVFSWLNEINPQLAKEIKNLNIKVEEGTPCIFCGQKMNICAHCFCYDIYEFLAEHSQKLAQEFASRFDFEIRKEIY